MARMGQPEAAELPEPRRAKARERARREREQRLAHALSEYEKIERAKRPGYNRTSKQQTGASISDPDARIMRHSSAPCALSYNVQVSTDAAAGIVIAIEFISGAAISGSVVPPTPKPSVFTPSA